MLVMDMCQLIMVGHINSNLTSCSKQLVTCFLPILSMTYISCVPKA